MSVVITGDNNESVKLSNGQHLTQHQKFFLSCVYFCVDGNCIHMVDTGIVQKLLELLDRHVEEGNVTVQHAALSALRNLAIPGELLHQSNRGFRTHTGICVIERSFKVHKVLLGLYRMSFSLHLKLLSRFSNEASDVCNHKEQVFVSVSSST